MELKFIENIHQDEYEKRRLDLLNCIPNNSLLVLFSNNLEDRFSTIKFQQNSNFFYLTGCDLSNHIAILVKFINSYKYTLFDLDHDYKFLVKTLNKYINKDKLLLFVENMSHTFKGGIIDILSNYCENNIISKLIDNMRSIKGYYEQRMLLHAHEIAALSITNALRYIKDNVLEKQIETNIYFYVLKLGASKLAYPIKVSREPCNVYYSLNNKYISDNDVLIIDVGVDYNGYKGSIARTIPVKGRFDDNYNFIYNLLIDIQNNIIDYMRDDYGHIDVIKKSVSVISNLKLKENGLSNLETNININSIGLDVVDSKTINRYIANMVFSLEIMIIDTINNKVYMQIKDSFLIMKDGYFKNLTSACPINTLDMLRVKSII